jgi:hypothetical protein
MTATGGRELYHLQFLLQAASSETFGYTLICAPYSNYEDNEIVYCLFYQINLRISFKFLINIQSFLSDYLAHSGSVPELEKGRALMLQLVV